MLMMMTWHYLLDIPSEKSEKEDFLKRIAYLSLRIQKKPTLMDVTSVESTITLLGTVHNEN